MVLVKAGKGAEVLNHDELLDMPDTGGTNSDHDARYVTLATALWAKTGTTLSPTTVGDDIRLEYSTAKYADFSVDSSGDLHIEPNGLQCYVAGILRLSYTLQMDGTGYSFHLGAGNEMTIAEYMYLRAKADDGTHLALYPGDGKGNFNFIITSYAARADDYDHSTPSATPTFFIHSDTRASSETDEWISFAHDATDGVITTGAGDLSLNPAGDVVVKNGWSGTFTNGDAATVTVLNGIITGVV